MEWGDLLATVLFFGVPAAVIYFGQRSLTAELERIDQALGLGLTPRRNFRVTREGMVGDCEVILSIRTADRSRRLLYVTIQLPRSLHITVGPEFGLVRRALEGRDLEIGCPEFDDLARIEGGEVALRALLFRRTRDALAPFVKNGGRFDGRFLRAYWIVDVLGDVEPLAVALAAAQALAEAGQGIEDPVAPLVQVAERDPYPTVRARTLDCLLRAFPDDARTTTAVRQALGDASPAVRRVAAVHLLDPEVLQGLLAPGVPEAEQQAAVEALLRLPDGLDRLQDHLSGLSGKARAAAVAALRTDGRGHDGGLALAEPTGDVGGLALHRPDPSE